MGTMRSGGKQCVIRDKGGGGGMKRQGMSRDRSWDGRDLEWCCGQGEIKQKQGG